MLHLGTDSPAAALVAAPADGDLDAMTVEVSALLDTRAHLTADTRAAFDAVLARGVEQRLTDMDYRAVRPCGHADVRSGRACPTCAVFALVPPDHDDPW